jgi:hypothetical protein
MFNAKCFQRSNASRVATEDGIVWDGGSDLPEDVEESVKYYKGWLHKDHRREITRWVNFTEL